MGMFDEVVYKNKKYQTKDLKCVMGEYRITDDGRLVTDTYKFVPADKVPIRFPRFKKEIIEKDVDTNHHGRLHFYGMKEGTDGYRDAKWVVYDAKFTNGKLVKIERREEEYY